MKASAYVRFTASRDLDLMDVRGVRNYLITTEHAASSYGLPVAVDRLTGEAMGPAEVNGELQVVGTENQDGLSREDIADALRRAGYCACPMRPD